MFFKEKSKIQIKDIGKNNLAKNRAILELLENVGTHHSDLIGYGVNDIKRTGLSWILLDWKLEVIKRPKYGEELEITTWGRNMKRAYTYRDFEIRDEEGNLCVIATTKWAFLNINTGRIGKITNEMVDLYKPEEKNVFNQDELEKIDVTEEVLSEYTYKISRRDIDLNNHMHNLYYLDIAYEALPEEIYNKRPFDNVRIEYKKEIKLGDTIVCKYSFVDEKNIVSIYANDEKNPNAIIILY